MTSRRRRNDRKLRHALAPHRDARTRMQQRGIPPTALELLLDFGRETHDHRGCRIVRFDKRSRRLALLELGRERYRKLERYFNAYAVVAEDDAIVTVGHRLVSSPRYSSPGGGTCRIRPGPNFHAA